MEIKVGDTVKFTKAFGSKFACYPDLIQAKVIKETGSHSRGKRYEVEPLETYDIWGPGRAIEIYEDRIKEVVKPEPKIGDIVKVKAYSNNFSPDVFRARLDYRNSNGKWNIEPLELYREITTDRKWGPGGRKTLNLVDESRIIEIEDTKMNKQVTIQDFLTAVNTCQGASAANKTEFTKRVLGGQYPETINGDDIVKAVRNYPGGCDNEKQKFVTGLGLDWDAGQVEYEITLRVKGTPRVLHSNNRTHSELWRLSFADTVRPAKQVMADYSDGLTDVSIKYVSEKKVK